MSRIGKKVIEIPEKTEVTVKGSNVSVKGPKGSLERMFGNDFSLKVEQGKATFVPVATLHNSAAWGTHVSHLENMIKGVNELFSKKLIIEGIGFKADVKGTDLV